MTTRNGRQTEDGGPETERSDTGRRLNMVWGSTDV